MPNHYVSRGGIKLEGALREFQIIPDGKICLDVGASTGGFTDCLLKHGAKKVYALDVGRGQLDWKLRQDTRVVVIERQNVRYLDRSRLSEKVDLVTIDVSFISLKLVFPVLPPYLKGRAFLVALVKPQFEVEKGDVGRGGIVRDPKRHKAVLEKVEAYGRELGWSPVRETPSPILGAKGNREFFISFQTG